MLTSSNYCGDLLRSVMIHTHLSVMLFWTPRAQYTRPHVGAALMHKNGQVYKIKKKTRLISMESQPKKVVLVVVVIVVVFVVAIIIGHKNLTLKFDQNGSIIGNIL